MVVMGNTDINSCHGNHYSMYVNVYPMVTNQLFVQKCFHGNQDEYVGFTFK